MSARLLRAAARELRATVNGCDADPSLVSDPDFKLAVADLFDALADDREADPYLPKRFDEPAVVAARAYVGDAL